VRVVRYYEVQPIFKIISDSRPSVNPDNHFLLNLELENVCSSATVQVKQVTIISPTWKFQTIASEQVDDVLPQQSCRLVLGASPTAHSSAASVDFVCRKLRDVLRGVAIEKSDPPPVTLCCSHTSQTSRPRSVAELATRHFIHSGRRNFVAQNIIDAHPHIPSHSYQSIFPLYHPHSVDIVVFWEILSQQRSGHLLVSGFSMGAGHAPLRDIIEEVENAKVARSMYAETRREKVEVIQAIMNSDWNAETDPMTLALRFEETVEHEFCNGPCYAPVAFILRNHSLTHKLRFLLTLTSDGTPTPSDLLPSHYHGRTTFRGTLEPSQLTTVHSKVWIHQPGTYVVAGWRLDHEVLETGTARIRHRYSQLPPGRDGPVITVCDADRTAV